jgi:replicative DNA helicase
VDSQRIAAERALLGAVLLDPAGQQHVLDYVEADDFLRPWHAQVHAAMGRVRRGGRHPGPREVYAELRNDPDLPADVAMDGVLVADLMAAAPRLGHATVYAAAVVESGIRQRLWIAGSRVRQVADSSDLGYALGQVAEARREVAACGDRWQRLPRAWRAELRHLADDVSVRPVAARPCGRDAESAGSGLLRDLAANPAQIGAISRWLRPEHFTDHRTGQLYSLMCDMADVGMAIDPVTVGREAARASVPVQAAELSGGTGAFAHVYARDLYSRAVLAQVSQAGAEIQTAAASPRGAMTPLLESAAEALAPGDARWHPEPWNSATPRSARELRTAIATSNAAELTASADRPREIEREASR